MSLVPLPTRTQGICPSFVSCHRWRGEIPRAFAASRGRRARGESGAGNMVVGPTVAIREVRPAYPLSQRSTKILEIRGSHEQSQRISLENLETLEVAKCDSDPLELRIDRSPIVDALVLTRLSAGRIPSV